MKRLILLLVTFLPALLWSQGQPFKYKNALKISPAEMANAEFQITYERYFGDRSSSILFMPSFILKDEGRETQSGWQAMMQYRFYLSQTKNTKERIFLGMHNIGFYAGAYGLYFDYDEDNLRGYHDRVTNQYTEGIFNQKINSVEGGAMVGMQIDITPRFLIDFYIGGGVRFSDVVDEFASIETETYYENYSIFDREYKGVKPKIGLQLGITF